MKNFIYSRAPTKPPAYVTLSSQFDPVPVIPGRLIPSKALESPAWVRPIMCPVSSVSNNKFEAVVWIAGTSHAAIPADDRSSLNTHSLLQTLI